MEVGDAFREQFDAEGPAVHVHRASECRAEAGERVEHEVTGAAAAADHVVYGRGEHVDVLLRAGRAVRHEGVVRGEQSRIHGVARCP